MNPQQNNQDGQMPMDQNAMGPQVMMPDGGAGAPQMMMPDQMQGQMQSQVQDPNMMQGQMPMQQMPMQNNQNAVSLGSAAIAANQASPNSGTKDSPISTQSTLLISELRDNVVIMKDGSFRAVVACKSINFDLMSDMEREGVEYSYQNFLNSLKFTTQI